LFSFLYSSLFSISQLASQVPWLMSMNNDIPILIMPMIVPKPFSIYFLMTLTYVITIVTINIEFQWWFNIHQLWWSKLNCINWNLIIKEKNCDCQDVVIEF
jgi:hypothetical protein